MDKDQILDVKHDIMAIKRSLEPRPDFDKIYKGFNVNLGDDYKLKHPHHIYYASKYTINGGAWTGKDGRILKLGSVDYFWKYFDQYLNEHHDEILTYIADSMTSLIKESGNKLVRNMHNELTSFENELKELDILDE